MSDLGTISTDAAAAAPPATATESPAPSPAPVATTDTSSSPTPPPGGGDDVFGDLPDRPVFDRGYVDRIRREGARHRTELREAQARIAEIEARANGYDEVFGQYEQADRDAWFQIARTWAENPVAGATMMQQIASNVLAQGGDMADVEAAQEAAIEQATAASEGNLTRDDVERMLADREKAATAAQTQQREIERINDEIRGAGFEPGTRDASQILTIAATETGGNIAAAVEQHKAYRQAIIDDYVQGKNNPGAAPAPDGGAGAPTPPEISNIEDAEKAFKAYLKGRGDTPG